MSKAAKRFVHYHLAFLEANREEHPRILGEFDQIARAWTMAQEIAGLFESEREREEALLDFVRHLHNALAVQGLWRSIYIPWDAQTALAEAVRVCDRALLLTVPSRPDDNPSLRQAQYKRQAQDTAPNTSTSSMRDGCGKCWPIVGSTESNATVCRGI